LGTERDVSVSCLRVEIDVGPLRDSHYSL
jgi:hypothetical protein